MCRPTACHKGRQSGAPEDVELESSSFEMRALKVRNVKYQHCFVDMKCWQAEWLFLTETELAVARSYGPSHALWFLKAPEAKGPDKYQPCS